MRTTRQKRAPGAKAPPKIVGLVPTALTIAGAAEGKAVFSCRSLRASVLAARAQVQAQIPTSHMTPVPPVKELDGLTRLGRGLNHD